jgi:hypothetical protein
MSEFHLPVAFYDEVGVQFIYRKQFLVIGHRLAGYFLSVCHIIYLEH